MMSTQYHPCTPAGSAWGFRRRILIPPSSFALDALSRGSNDTSHKPARDGELLNSPSMLATLGALITVALGLLGALAPATVARLVGVQPVGGVGLSEVRATYGGLFLGLGGACLVLQSPVAWLVAGIAWVGAALMRLPSLVLDKGSYPKALGGFALELTVGLLLLSGAR